jgi:glutamine synthetase
MTSIVTYIWIDGDGNLREKSRTHETGFSGSIQTLPNWSYDGSSTGQAPRENSEVELRPVAVFDDPLRRGVDRLVLCETFTFDGRPTATNNRHNAKKIFDEFEKEIPWYGLEQEFFIMDPKNHHRPGHGSAHYCGVGTTGSVNTVIMNEFYEHCLNAKLKISGINAEVTPGQWEFQIGPSVGISAGDHMYVARYLLQKVAEKYDRTIDFHPKPYDGNCNGSGCHTNFSTYTMRWGFEEKSGLEFINDAIDKLEEKHDEHMEIYGKDNKKRMTGDHETASYHVFSSSVAGRGTSIRIPLQVSRAECGYLEDRRPASNCDPYLVTSKIMETVGELS